MKRARVRQGMFWLLVCSLLFACSADTTVPTAITPTAESTAPVADVFIVDVWVSNPNPLPAETVIIIGTIQRNGLYLNHVTMNATWPDPDNPRNMPNCTVQVLYQRGVCSTPAGKYPSGVYVPIDVSFAFQGQTFTGQTGFTPK